MILFFLEIGKVCTEMQKKYTDYAVKSTYWCLKSELWCITCQKKISDTPRLYTYTLHHSWGIWYPQGDVGINHVRTHECVSRGWVEAVSRVNIEPLGSDREASVKLEDEAGGPCSPQYFAGSLLGPCVQQSAVFLCF